MKKLLATGLATLALLAVTLSAAATPVGIGIYGAANPTNADRCKTIGGFTLFNLYLVGTELGCSTGWEAGVSWGDDSWSILSSTLSTTGAINVGSAPKNFIVGLGLEVNAPSRYTLVQFQVGYFANPIAPELQVCIGPSSPSTAEFNGGPGYSTCGDDLIPLVLLQPATANYNEGCAIVNPIHTDDCNVGLASSDASFGQVKARY